MNHKILLTIGALVLSFISSAGDKEDFIEMCKQSPEHVNQLRNVNWLNIGGGCENVFEEINNLEVVVLSGRTFQRTDLKDASLLQFFKNAKELRLTGHTGIRNIHTLANLNLVKLDLLETDVNYDFISSLNNLEELVISIGDKRLSKITNSGVKRISVNKIDNDGVLALAKLSNLTDLRIGEYGQFQSQLTNISKVKNLIKLEIINNDIDINHISKMPLKDLKLYFRHGERRNKIKNLDSIGAMTTLSILHLVGAGMEFTRTIGRLTNLEELDLSKNLLIRFDIYNFMPKLKKLIAVDNKIELIFKLNAPALEELNLGNNNISSNFFSEYFPNFRHLKKLSLKNNRVFSLKDLHLSNLQELDASQNLIPVSNQICLASVKCNFEKQLTI